MPKSPDQPRNSRSQFAPVREVIYIDSDDSDFSSEVRVPRGKRVKGEPSTPIPAKKIKGEPLTPIPSFNDKNKVRSAFPLLGKPFFSDIHDSGKLYGIVADTCELVENKLIEIIAVMFDRYFIGAILLATM